jgi:hypothetical protein
MKKTFSIVTTVYGTFELLRQLAESVIAYIDKEQLDKFIIVDDFSCRDGKLHKYYDYLEETYDWIEVIRFPQYRANIYKVRKDRVEDFSPFNSEKCNLGPALAVQVGLEAVESEFVLIVDSDTFFLKKAEGLLNRLWGSFQMSEDIMCMGQVLGLNSDELHVFAKLYYSLFELKFRNGTCGEVSPMAYACRMSGWKEHCIEQISYGPAMLAWNNTFYMMSIYQESFKTMNFPLFSEGYMVHIGGATVKKGYGFTRDFKIYGGRTGDFVSDYYSGVYFVDMTKSEYNLYLAQMRGRPFNGVEPIDEGKVGKLKLRKEHEYKGYPTKIYREHFFDPAHKFYRKPRAARTLTEQTGFTVMQKNKRKGYITKLAEHVK